MPALETIDLHQRAVLWTKAGDDIEGRPLVMAPVEIACRWERGAREGLKKDGTLVRLDAFVVVAQDVVPDSILWEGTLAEWNATGSASGDHTDLMQVVIVKNSPDVKGQNRRRTLGLQMYSDQLPGSA